MIPYVFMGGLLEEHRVWNRRLYVVHSIRNDEL